MTALSTKTAGGHPLAFWPLIALNLDSKEGYERFHVCKTKWQYFDVPEA